MKQSKILSVLLAVLMACLVLSSSVAVPILCRPFYYAHIGPLGLVQATGLTEEAIRQAYDEMLDFCLGAPEFSTGRTRNFFSLYMAQKVHLLWEHPMVHWSR